MAGLENSYTDAVNQLLSDPDAVGVILAPKDKSQNVNGGKIGRHLMVQNFSAIPGKSGGKSIMRSVTGNTFVYRNGLSAPSRLYGVSSSISPESLFKIAIVHEGLHAAYSWSDNMFGEASSKYDSELHQAPFNSAAMELLK